MLLDEQAKLNAIADRILAASMDGYSTGPRHSCPRQLTRGPGPMLSSLFIALGRTRSTPPYSVS
jgi:hypothetical protein